MTSEVKIKVTAENATGKSLKDVKDDFRDVETASDKAGNKMAEFGRRSAAVKHDLDGLDNGLAKNRSSLSSFSDGWSKLGESMGKIDIKGSMDKIRTGVESASKNSKIKLSNMIDWLPDLGKVGSFVGKIGSALGSAASTVGEAVKGPWGMAIGAGVAATAAPILMQTLSAALSAGAGLAVIGGGLALAVKNDAGIQQAGQDAGLKFMKSLAQGVKVYTGPILSSIGILRDAGDRMGKVLSGAFAATSSSVVPLVRDITQGVERFVSAIAGIASDSGPALAGFGDMFRLIMEGVSDAMEAMTEDSESLGSSLVAIGGFIGDVIRWTGELIGWLNKIGDAIAPILWLKNHYREAAEASDEMVGSTSAVANAMTNAEKAARGEMAALSGLSAELKAQTDPVFGLIKAQQDMREAQKAASDAVKKHGKNSDEAKEAYRRQALAAIDLEGQVGKLGNQFNGKMTPALRATLKAAGATDAAINSLEGQFAAAKRTGDRFAKRYTANVKVEGAAAARNSLYGVQDAANAIPRAVTIAMRITGVSNVSAAAAAVRKQYAHGGITGAATGGVQGGGFTWVGEQGPELMKLPAGTTVKSNPDSMRSLTRSDMGRYHSEMNDLWESHAPSRTELAGRNRPGSPYKKKRSTRGGSGGGSGGSGGGGGYDGELVARWEPSGNAFLDSLADVIRLYVKNNGGGNVQDAFGQRGRG